MDLASVIHELKMHLEPFLRKSERQDRLQSRCADVRYAPCEAVKSCSISHEISQMDFSES